MPQFKEGGISSNYLERGEKIHIHLTKAFSSLSQGTPPGAFLLPNPTGLLQQAARAPHSPARFSQLINLFSTLRA